MARRTVCCRLSFLSTCACGKTHSLLPSEFSFDLRLWQEAQASPVSSVSLTCTRGAMHKPGFSLRVFRTCTCGQACACGQNTIFPISRVFQACACGKCTSKAPILKSVSAKVMDVESRLPGCAGQAADAVSAHTQVKMEDAPTLLKIPKSECPDIGIRLPKTQMAQIMVQYGRPSCSS